MRQQSRTRWHSVYAGDQYQPPSSSTYISTSAVLRTTVSTCMGGAEGNTGTGHTPRLNSRPACQRGTGQDVRTSGEDKPHIDESLPYGFASRTPRMCPMGRDEYLDYSPLGNLCLFIYTGIYQLYFFASTYCIHFFVCIILCTIQQRSKHESGYQQQVWWV